ncbi:MAG: MOP flippase family protein [Candidatus Krumholzibacteriota bacterium]|nr:MOP flippase family protein [Candidatus Krumholzibacteriota bacterium]
MNDTPREELGELRRSAASGARWTALATGTRVVTQFVQLAFLGRLLGSASDFGMFAMVNVVVVLGQSFADVGISNAIIHYQDATRRELSSLYWLHILAGFVVFGVAYAFAPLVAAFYHEPSLIAPLRVGVFVFLIAPVGQQFQVLMEKEFLFRRLAAIETTATVIGAVIAVACAWQGKGVHSLVYGLVAAVAVKALALAVMGWRRWRPAPVLKLSLCRRFLRFGAFQVGERMVQALGQQLDKILIGVLMGPSALGYYDLAYRLVVRPFQMINPIFTRVGFPVFARVQDDVLRLRKGFLHLVEVIAAVLAPVYAMMIALAVPFIHVQLGPDYDPSIRLLRILSLLGFLLGLGNPIGSVILARGRADVAFYLNVLRLFVLAGAITIGSRFGLEGIAWGLVAAIFFVMIPIGFRLRYWLIDLRAMPYLSTIAPFLIPAAVSGVVGYVLTTHLPWQNDFVILGITLPVTGIIYLGLLRIFHPERLRRIWSLARS